MTPNRQEIELEQAVALIAETRALPGEKTVLLQNARGMILARDIISDIDQPPFNRSPLDGYALRSEDTTGASPQSPVTFTVTDKLCAGDVPAGPVEKGQAVRIMTGAMLPRECDCVIRQEETDYGEEQVTICRPLKRHENFCFRGEDFKAGTLLLAAGTKLGSAALGILASAGIWEVPVRPKAKVALMVTGDELFEPHPEKTLPPGKIYSSNLTLLHTRLWELGTEEVSAIQTGDDPQTIANLIRVALKDADVLITTGGVSVGEKDCFYEVMHILGVRKVFHGVNMKPGTPAMFSYFDEKPILSLSGNPFAAAATFELLARPLLCALNKDSSLLPAKTMAVLANDYGKKSPSRRFLRARLENGLVSLPDGHSSGQLHSLTGCNCLAEIAPYAQAQKGDTIVVYLM